MYFPVLIIVFGHSTKIDVNFVHIYGPEQVEIKALRVCDLSMEIV